MKETFPVQYPNWQQENCTCCAGLQWGGEYPRECLKCDGAGTVYVHTPSGVRAKYPGGSFLGRWQS